MLRSGVFPGFAGLRWTPIISYIRFSSRAPTKNANLLITRKLAFFLSKYSRHFPDLTDFLTKIPTQISRPGRDSTIRCCQWQRDKGSNFSGLFKYCEVLDGHHAVSMSFSRHDSPATVPTFRVLIRTIPGPSSSGSTVSYFSGEG